MTIENKDKRVSAEHIIRLSVPFLWAGVIFWLSLSPSPPQIPGVLGWDKLLHACAYGLLTILIAQFYLCLSSHSDYLWWYSGLLAVGYGALLEVLQLLSYTGRTAEWWDLVADITGAFLAWMLFRNLFSAKGEMT